MFRGEIFRTPASGYGGSAGADDLRRVILDFEEGLDAQRLRAEWQFAEGGRA